MVHRVVVDISAVPRDAVADDADDLATLFLRSRALAMP